MEKITRRDFLIKVGMLAMAGMLDSPPSSRVPNHPDQQFTEPVETDIEGDFESEPITAVMQAQDLPDSTQLKDKLLQEHLENTYEERERIKSKILDLPGGLDQPSEIFSPLRRLTKSQILEDWEMYSPIYLAASQEFAVPPFLLWVIHVDETTVSRSPSPGATGHVGAMQRMPAHRLLRAYDPHSGEEEFEVTGSWWFLKGLPQRWFGQSPAHSFDYVEIFWAAEFIRRKYHQFYQRMEREAGMLAVLENNYSGIGGPARVAKYRQLKQLFQIIP